MDKKKPPSKAAIESLRSQGKTREEIAEIYGVKLSTVKKWISDLNVQRLPKGYQPRRAPKKKTPKEPTLSEGYTVLDIAQFRLGHRMTEDWRGYLLDGRLCNLDDILEAAGLLK